MDIESVYKSETKNNNYDYAMTRAFVSGYLVARFGTQLKQIPEEIHVEVFLNGITCCPKTREATVKLLQIFGGKWDKEVDVFYKDKMVYSQSIENPFAIDLKIRLSEAPPPPCCQIVEEEVEVPATKVIKRRMVCPTPIEDEPCVIDPVLGGPTQDEHGNTIGETTA
jgi:hypothetical protein